MKSIIVNLMIMCILIITGLLILFKFWDFYTLKGETLRVPKLVGTFVNDLPENTPFNFHFWG
jgi:hypothetical protein